MLLTILTRTYQRPSSLQRNQASLASQTCQDFEQEILEDKVGVGCGEAFRQFWTISPKGDYVWALDDDDYVASSEFIQAVKDRAKTKPDVIIVSARVIDRILPDRFPLELACCGGLNIIVSRAVWMKHRKDWGLRYEGDWDFINAVMLDDPKIEYIREPMVVLDHHSLGLSDEQFSVGDFDIEQTRLALPFGSQVIFNQGVNGPIGHADTDEIFTVNSGNKKFLETMMRDRFAEVYPRVAKKK